MKRDYLEIFLLTLHVGYFDLATNLTFLWQIGNIAKCIKDDKQIFFI